MLTIWAGVKSFDEMRERKPAFVLRLKWSDLNLATYLVRGERMPLGSSSANPSKSSPSTLSAKAAARTSTPIELPSASVAEKIDLKMVVSWLTQ